jgi:long-chain alkane monooxygenase
MNTNLTSSDRHEVARVIAGTARGRPHRLAIPRTSERYRIEGPHLVAPSPQRTPLLFQAGSSSTGRDFAARNAEAQFIISPDPASAKALIDDTRQLLARPGRHPDDLKFFPGLSFVVGSTEAEGHRKEAELEEKIDLDGMVSHLGGALGIDLGHYDLDTPLENIETQGFRSILAWVQESTPGRSPTVEDLGRLQGRRTRIVGTPEQIADRLDQWGDAGVDGVNVVNATIPGSYDIFIDHVLPVLRDRGLARRDYEPGTLRRKIFGSDRLPKRHKATRYRGAFGPSVVDPTPVVVVAE